MCSLSGPVQYRQKCNKHSIRKRSLCTLRAEGFPSLGKGHVIFPFILSLKFVFT